MKVVAVDESRILTELRKTSYFETGSAVRLEEGEADETPIGKIGEIPPVPLPLSVRKGDSLLLTRAQSTGHEARIGAEGAVESPMQISCTAPEAVESLKVGESVWFDDGKIGGTVRHIDPAGALIEITSAPPGGIALGPDKGINMPDTDLHLPAISQRDDEALQFIAKNAELVGQSFVRTPRDVLALQSRLKELGGGNVGIVLKIETKQAFNNLPSLLFAALKSRAPAS